MPRPKLILRRSARLEFAHATGPGRHREHGSSDLPSGDGAAYDVERDLKPYNGSRDFAEIKDFFGGRCCYCDAEFGPGRRAVQDHLIPMNKNDTGLHAWGNIVPACDECNAMKQGGNWQAFIIQRAGVHAKDRHDRVLAFLAQYHYAPARDLKEVAADLYDEVGGISMTLIRTKIKRMQGEI